MRVWFVARAVLAVISAAASFGQTWTQLAPKVSPPTLGEWPGIGAFDIARGQLVIYVGQFPSQTWVWDGSNWIQKSPAHNPNGLWPSGMAYDARHAQTVLLGWVLSGTIGVSQTWVWDGTDWTEKNPSTSPPARTDAAMTYDAARGQVVVFGGQGVNAPNAFAVADLNDTWVWDGSNWTQKTTAAAPSARQDSTMTYNPATGQVVLYGGRSSLTPTTYMDLPETWTWNGSAWTQHMASGPSAAYGVGLAPDASGRVVLFGGGVDGTANEFGQPVQTYNQTWLWDGTFWTLRGVVTGSPSIRDFPAMAYDPVHGATVLFGGEGPQDIHFTQPSLNDTWTWTIGGTQRPRISGVVSAGAFGGFVNAAPGSWIEIYGAGLATDSRQWALSDFNGNTAPTSLDGVQVTIGGQNAAIDYISSTQVNAQVPAGVAAGLQPLVVTSAQLPSIAYMIMATASAPGLLAPASFNISGNQYVVAVLPDGSYVLPTGAIPGVASRPAKPGETITMYGIGFGPVTPNIAPGQIVTEANQLAQPLQVLFGKTPAAAISYEGLAPQAVGLYQFNVVVPAVGDSDLVPLSFTLGGVSGGQVLFTAVKE